MILSNHCGIIYVVVSWHCSNFLINGFCLFEGFFWGEFKEIKTSLLNRKELINFYFPFSYLFIKIKIKIYCYLIRKIPCSNFTLLWLMSKWGVYKGASILCLIQLFFNGHDVHCTFCNSLNFIQAWIYNLTWL